MAARKKSPTKKAPKKKTERNLTRELSTLLAKRLLPNLKERAKEPPVAAALAAEFEAEKQRTADNFDTWMSHKLEQVAVAWILSCVFVRTLEDRGYLTQRRLAGEGVHDAEHLFFDLFPSLTARDYLLAVFRELSHLPGAEDVLGPKRNLAWRLAPSSEVVRELLGVFRETDAEGQLAWQFAGSDTRFLGDLYQDISEGVRERFALLQTPEFVEEFILDLTLEPAVREFGLETVRLLDPTCGSGHFLLGAFRRLFEARQRHAPGLPVKEHATAALAQVAGADINPYAVAIARFRLALAYLEAAQIEKLRDAPRLSTSVVTVDSLLIGANQRTLPLAAHSENAAAWGESHWQLEDREEALRVFRRQYYHAVVGNPPYITCKDAKLRDEYRAAYPDSASGKYALAAPFTERFFQLAIDDGFVGLINANSFLKREFGKRLIEKVLKALDLTRVMDTAGAYIPGHGTPTVLLFGRNRAPLADTIVAVMGKRGEPETPANPVNGLVWSSIRDHFGEVGFENDFVSVAQVPRTTFDNHPWSLGGGGAAELKALLEERAERRLGQIAEDIGFASFTGLDEVFIQPIGVLARQGVPDELIRPMVTGETVRDWSAVTDQEALTPYSRSEQMPLPLADAERWAKFMWPFRACAEGVSSFGGRTRAQEGQNWWEWYRWQSERYRIPFRITFAFVATHNHFVLDRGGKVFKQSAPIIKLPQTATEDDHLALLAYLNSSTACFWMKQVCHRKTNASQKHSTDPARAAYEFSGTPLQELPVPGLSDPMLKILGARLLTLAAERSKWLAGVSLRSTQGAWETDGDLRAALKNGWEIYDKRTREAVYTQEELDWLVYRRLGLWQSAADEGDPMFGECALGQRPFEHALGYQDGVSDRARNHNGARAAETNGMPAHWLPRTQLAADSPLRTLEDRAFKRMWRDTEQNVDQLEFRRSLEVAWLHRAILDEVEQAATADVSVRSSRQLTRAILDLGRLNVVSAFLTVDSDLLVRELMQREAAPFLSAFRYTDTGLQIRADWESAWDLQRREDTGEKVLIPVPPKYDSKDYRDPIYWRLRGKLDVPKERFISYPGAEKDDDPSPLYGWAGWDHLQRATALAGLYHERKTEEAWPPDRLVPLLAGLLELVPWLKQWHNVPSDELGGEGAGDWYDRYVAAEARSLGKTLDDLRAWRPTPKAGRSRARTR